MHTSSGSSGYSECSLQPFCGLFLFFIFLQCLPLGSCLGCFWNPHPPMLIWVSFTSSSCFCWEEPVVQRVCLLRLTYTPRWKQLQCWGVPVESGSWGYLVPEPGQTRRPVRADRARLSAVSYAQVPGVRGTCTTSTAVLVAKRPGLFNLRGFPGAGQGSLNT